MIHNHKIRSFSVDDLILIDMLGDGYNGAQIARALNVTQPAISARLSRLESSLGVDLYVRKGKASRLTDEAKSLVPLCRITLNNLDKILASWT